MKQTCKDALGKLQRVNDEDFMSLRQVYEWFKWLKALGEQEGL